MTLPYWLDEPAPPVPDVHVERPDAVVVGGGITGCSCALSLAHAGLRVRLHEAREIAGGASGRNGGFALRGGAAPYDVTAASIGREAAGRLWRETERALDRIEALAGDAFRRTGSLRLAADDEERESLRAEHDALRADGFQVERIDIVNGGGNRRFPRWPPSLQPDATSRGVAAAGKPASAGPCDPACKSSRVAPTAAGGRLFGRRHPRETRVAGGKGAHGGKPALSPRG